jgi:uncharacterized protein (UPF0276 family)
VVAAVAVAAVAVVAAAVVVAVGAEMMGTYIDRVGIGWRPDLAAGIFENLGEIDLLEVIADDFFAAPARDIRALKSLSSQVPVTLHGIGMGLAASAPVDSRYLDRMARLLDQVRPESWSEHLAFVRAGGIEIGHLAAPPRTPENIDGAAENLFRAERTTGRKPLLENIATLVVPPASSLSESVWISSILNAADCDLLLDLHNVFANGFNHGYDAKDFLSQIPPSRVRAVHIAGGKLISASDGSTRILDDHLHDVPDAVFDLLEESAAISPNPLAVILERDGAYPPMPELLVQIRRARHAVERGRAKRAALQAVLV